MNRDIIKSEPHPNVFIKDLLECTCKAPGALSENLYKAHVSKEEAEVVLLVKLLGKKLNKKQVTALFDKIEAYAEYRESEARREAAEDAAGADL